MNINDLILKFDELIYSSLYTHTNLDENEKKVMNDVSLLLKKEKNIKSFLNVLMKNATKDNSYQYKNYIKDIISNTNIDVKIIYDNISEDFEFSLDLFLKLSVKEAISFIEKKKFLTNYDMILINDYINKNNNFLLKLLANNLILNKIPKNSLSFKYTKKAEKYISLENKDTLSKLDKATLSNFIKIKFKSFDDFLKISDFSILNDIYDNTLLFNTDNVDDIKDFIIKNPSIASKFNSIYFESFNIDELYSLFNKGIVNPYILSSMLKNGIDVNLVYSAENISKCISNSITFKYFDLLNDDLRKTIINEPKLLNKFNEYIIFEVISKYLTEDEIIKNLRNPLYLNDLNPYVLELIINNLSFKSLFNMIQNHLIFEKIDNINAKITDNDKVFIRGYLDSTILVNKTSSNMIYNMLLLVDSNVVFEYLSYPYILEKINNDDLINLIIKNNIDFKLVIENDYIYNRLNTGNIVKYINELWTIKIDLNLISNPKVLKRLFNIDEKMIKSINFDEVNYLFETIRTKDILSIQESVPTVSTYYAILSSYLTFGIKGTINLITEGTRFISVDDMVNAITNITRYKVTEFRNNNFLMLHNLDKKVADKLKNISYVSLEDFKQKVMDIPFLENLIRLMVSCNYTTLNEVLNVFYNYKTFETNFNARKELKEYCDAFSLYCLDSKKKEFSSELYEIAKKNCILKPSLASKDYQNKLSIWLKKTKLQLFIKALQGEDVSNVFFDSLFIDHIREKFSKYLGNSLMDLDKIIEDVLIPLSNDELDIFDCLNKSGIKKPKDYDTYQRINRDIMSICNINDFIFDLDEPDDVIIEILNYIVYGSKITSNLKTKLKTKLKELRYQALEILGEIYVDKASLKIVYGSTVDIENEDEIIEYINYIELLNTVCTKTYNYINRHLSSSNIQRIYYNDFNRQSKKINIEHEFNSSNYIVKERIFSLNDLEKMLKGFNISNSINIDTYLEKLLYSNNVIFLTALGLYDSSIKNLGYIISCWQEVKKICTVHNIDISTLDIFDVNKIVLNMNRGYTNSKDLDLAINDLSCSSYYYEIPNIKDRIALLNRVHNYAKTKNAKSIPMLGVSNEEYSLAPLDSHTQLNYMIGFNSEYQIGATESDLLSYSVLSKDGIVLVIKDINNDIIGRINGIRNGNVLFLTNPTLLFNIDIKDLLLNYARKILDFTKLSEEPINMVLINNYNWGINIDKSTCTFVNKPVLENDSEYMDLINKKCIIKNNINEKFNKGIFTILCSNVPISRDSFNSYSANAIYPRIRNEVIELNGMCSSYQLKAIEEIIESCLSIDNQNSNKINIENYEKIFLLDDAVILIDKDSKVTTYILPFDERAVIEVDTIVHNLDNKNKLLYK